MFLYAPDFFLDIPGTLLFITGLLLSGSLFNGPYWIGALNLNLHWMLLGVTLTAVGCNAIQLSFLSKVFYNFKPAVTQRILKIFTYNQGTLWGIFLILCGLALGLTLVHDYIVNGLRLIEISHTAVFGLMLIILGFQIFTFTLLLHMISNGRQGTELNEIANETFIILWRTRVDAR